MENFNNAAALVREYLRMLHDPLSRVFFMSLTKASNASLRRVRRETSHAFQSASFAASISQRFRSSVNCIPFFCCFIVNPVFLLCASSKGRCSRNGSLRELCRGSGELQRVKRTVLSETTLVNLVPPGLRAGERSVVDGEHHHSSPFRSQ